MTRWGDYVLDTSRYYFFKCSGQRGKDAHIPLDGPGGSTRGGSIEKRRLHNAEARMSD